MLRFDGQGHSSQPLPSAPAPRSNKRRRARERIKSLPVFWKNPAVAGRDRAPRSQGRIVAAPDDWADQPIRRPRSHHARPSTAFVQPQGPTPIHSERHRLRTSRGFLPWRVSDDGPQRTLHRLLGAVDRNPAREPALEGAKSNSTSLPRCLRTFSARSDVLKDTAAN
jgi:hypothetical protein